MRYERHANRSTCASVYARERASGRASARTRPVLLARLPRLLSRFAPLGGVHSSTLIAARVPEGRRIMPHKLPEINPTYTAAPLGSASLFSAVRRGRGIRVDLDAPGPGARCNNK